MIVNGETPANGPARLGHKNPPLTAAAGPLCSGRQPGFLLARGPRGEPPEVRLRRLSPPSRRRPGGGGAGRHGDGDTQVQRPASHLRAAAAAGPGPRSVRLRDLQSLRFHGDGGPRAAGTGPGGALQQVAALGRAG